MATTTNAFGAITAGGGLQAVAIDRRDVGPTDLQIAIDFCGVCHSDIAMVSAGMGQLPTSPFVPGHEIVGTLTAVGAEVTGRRVGDRVAVGSIARSCGECGPCRASEEQFCKKGFTSVFGGMDLDGTWTQGGFSESIVVDDRYVLDLPEGLDPAGAAPLLCAGITVYSPLRRYKVGEGSRVAIVGLGGLGHLAVKIAKAMGAEVTVLSQSDRKRDDASRLGADHYFATADGSVFEELANSFDLILNTVSATINVDAYLGLLDLDGALVNVGLTMEPAPVSAFSLFVNRRTYAGANIGGIAETKEMLQFCAERGITADVEIIRAKQVNEAFRRVQNSDVRYRFVIDGSTYAG